MGTAVPSRSVSQERAAELTSQIAGHGDEQTLRLATLYRLTGIEKRHSVILENPRALAAYSRQRGPTTGRRMRLYDEHVRPLAREAARKALLAADLAAGEITHLVTVSCTGFCAPGFDLALVDDLDLTPSVERTHIGFMGCHGALNGIRVARAFIESNPYARVLLCCAELCSLHFRFDAEANNSVPNALFADGAAALAAVPDYGGRDGLWRSAASGSFIVPRSHEAIAWHIGNYGFEMHLSPDVCGLIASDLGPWLESWLGHRGIGVEDILSWAVHPGGPRILDVVEESLGLERRATRVSREVLSACGNMSSPTVLFILKRLMEREAPRPCVALAFGPGLTIEATLFV
jgi:predicted naringenin-chalcone synthase